MENTVLEVLSKSKVPMKSGEIADAAGIDKKDVDQAIKRLKTDNLIASPKRCFYEIKK